MTKPSPNPAAPTATITRVRIASHVTQSRFLHVEDSLKIGKIRLYAGNFRKHEGVSSLTAHFLDVSDARVLFEALVNSSVTV